MNIIFDIENIEQIKNNAVVLELDTFYFSKLDKTATAYCVVDNIKITDFDKIAQIQKFHADLIDAYKRKDFKLCQDLIEVLMGSFEGEVDSFYSELYDRIFALIKSESLTNWTNIILRED
jgi:hypothetical protein